MVAIFSKEVDNLEAMLVQAGHDGDGQISEPESQHTAQPCGSHPPEMMKKKIMKKMMMIPS